MEKQKGGQHTARFRTRRHRIAYNRDVTLNGCQATVAGGRRGGGARTARAGSGWGALLWPIAPSSKSETFCQVRLVLMIREKKRREREVIFSARSKRPLGIVHSRSFNKQAYFKSTCGGGYFYFPCFKEVSSLSVNLQPTLIFALLSNFPSTEVFILKLVCIFVVSIRLINRLEGQFLV